jgi:methionyl-tRNA formyltransferase
VDAGHDVRIVVTRPDKRRGRGGEASPTPVKRVATELDLPVVDSVPAVLESGAELGVVVAFGRIIKPDVLAALPMVNVHFSLLPRWRGAAPVERAILAGDERTGVCLMEVDEGLDTGGVFRCREVSIGPDETAPALTARLARLGASTLVDALAAGLGRPEPQVGEATYAAKVEPDELRLDWARPAVELHRVVRVGRAWTTWRGKRLLVVSSRIVELPAGGSPRGGSSPGGLLPGGLPPGRLPPGTLVGDVVVTGEGGLRLVTVQPEGKASASGPDWLRGARPAAGERLGS